MSWLNEAFAISGLILAPFGPVSELLRNDNPWHGFEAQGPVLWVVRVQQIPSNDCSSWIQSLMAEKKGLGVEVVGSPQWKAWEPWNPDDFEAITRCDKFPCAVKFNSAEVSQMAASREESREKVFQTLVKNRCDHYDRTQERKEYEFSGAPIDPWDLLEKRGFVSTVHRPEKDSLWIRKTDFAPGKIRTIRQVLDRRTAKNTLGTEAVVWIRDVYTDHYFDSWGEWIHLSCDPAGEGKITLTHALILELDELKKTDLVARIMRGKMKSAVEKSGQTYLDQAFERISKGLNLDKHK